MMEIKKHICFILQEKVRMVHYIQEYIIIWITNFLLTDEEYQACLGLKNKKVH